MSCCSLPTPGIVNTLRQRQTGRHFSDDIFKCDIINEMFCILIWISLKFVPKGSIDNNSALISFMAWHKTGDKALSEPMLVCCTDAYMHHLASMSEGDQPGPYILAACQICKWAAILKAHEASGRIDPSKLMGIILYADCLSSCHWFMKSQLIILVMNQNNKFRVMLGQLTGYFLKWCSHKWKIMSESLHIYQKIVIC